MLVIGSSLSVFVDLADNFVNYIGGFFEMTIFRDEYLADDNWFSGWTMFYWFWWISWSPFVATFIARISKGRTLREMAIYGVIVPSLFSFLWMSVLGETAIDMQLNNTADLANVVANDSSMGLFKMLEQLPIYEVTAFVSIFLVGTFFITSSDSGSLVVDFMTSGGKLDAPRGQKVFWAFMEGAIAIALLVGGGLTALQSASISTGFPFAVILILVSFSLLKSLFKDPQISKDK